jgi:hypothetical protein
MKSLFPIGVEFILILRSASLAFGRVLILDCHPELQWVRHYLRDSSYGMLQKITYQMAFEEIANRNHAHLRPHPSGWQTSTVQPIIAALSHSVYY